MQMQLSSDAQIPDGLLAAMTLLNEKPRLGFRTWENTPYPGFQPAQSTTALGHSWSVASGTWWVSLSCEFGACGFLPQSGPAIQKYSDQFAQGISFIMATYHEMVKANVIGADRYYHCKAMYGATSLGGGGEAAAISMSWGREIGDTFKYQARRLWPNKKGQWNVPGQGWIGDGLHLSDSLEDSMGDLTADYMGIRGAGGSLEGACGSLRVRGIP